MELLLRLTIYLHALSGFTALIAGGLAMGSAKGKPAHRRAGKIYFYGMSGVFVTAVIVSLAKNLPFLLMVGFFSYHMVCSGYRALSLKKLHRQQRPALIDWTIAGLAGTFNTALLAWGLYKLLHDSQPVGIIALVFGLIGMQFVLQNLRTYFRKPKDKNHWLQSHIGGMIGGYIATWTAFLVVNISFLPALLTWLGPTAIGLPVIIYHIRRVRQKPVKSNPWTPGTGVDDKILK